MEIYTGNQIWKELLASFIIKDIKDETSKRRVLTEAQAIALLLYPLINSDSMDKEDSSDDDFLQVENSGHPYSEQSEPTDEQVRLDKKADYQIDTISFKSSIKRYVNYNFKSLKMYKGSISQMSSSRKEILLKIYNNDSDNEDDYDGYIEWMFHDNLKGMEVSSADCNTVISNIKKIFDKIREHINVINSYDENIDFYVSSLVIYSLFANLQPAKQKRCNYFIGRECELSYIQDQIVSNSNTIIKGSRGIGKKQIIKKA